MGEWISVWVGGWIGEWVGGRVGWWVEGRRVERRKRLKKSGRNVEAVFVEPSFNFISMLQRNIKSLRGLRILRREVQ